LKVPTPDILRLPVPVISLELRSRLPPSCGVVSSTTFLRTPVNPEPPPENSVAVRVPLEELKVRLDPVFGFTSPVAAVENTGKQVVSELSSATVIVRQLHYLHHRHHR